MPVSLGTAAGSIQINTSDLDRVEVKARRVGNSVRTSLGSMGTGAKQAQTGVAGLAGGVNALAAAYLALKLVTTAYDLGSTAATNERARASFDRLAAGVGSSGDRMLAAMQKGSRGAIANSELILNANRAILLGAADTNEELVKLLEVARVRGQAVGLSTGEAFTRLTQGIGKLEIEILDELGLAVKLIPTYKAFADSIGTTVDALTEAQKRQALFNTIVAKSQGLIDDTAGSADDAASSFERFETAVTNAKQAVGESVLGGGLPGLLDWLAKRVTALSDALEKKAKQSRQMEMDWNTGPVRSNIASAQLMQTGLLAGRAQLQNDLATGTGQSREMTQTMLAENAIKLAAVNAELTRFGATLALASGSVGAATSPYQRGLAFNAANMKTAPGVGGRTDEQISLIKDWAAGVRSIEKDANSARLDATQSYESQRSDTIRSYEQSIARDAQDFAISRARAAKQLADTIAQIGSDAAKREADWQNDLNQSVATITAEGNSRVAEIEKDYQRSRERAESNHRDNLFSAAARLDAVAVANEQRQFARSSKEAETDYRERLSSEQANIQERIAQENAAHRVRLEDAREADRQRISDATEALAESQRIEDEDRALSASRRAEDHAAQLQEMAVAQGERMAQIARHAAEERAQLDEEFKAALEKEGVHNQQWLLQQVELKRLAEQQFDLFWKHINDTFAASVLGPKTKAESAAGVGVDPGWFSSFSDPFGKAAGGTRSTSTRTSTINIAAGSIVINAAASQSPDAIAAAVDRRLLETFRSLSN